MLQLAPRGEIAVPRTKLEALHRLMSSRQRRSKAGNTVPEIMRQTDISKTSAYRAFG